MAVLDDVQSQQRNAARLELRRMVTNGEPPSDLDLAAFGEWQEYIHILRRAYLKYGTAICRQAFARLAQAYPALGLLLSTDPEPEKRVLTLREVLDLDLPEPEWVVPGLLPAGLATLAGRPKTGKSWLALQIACAVGTGGRVLDRPVKQGQVLYLALEDGWRRLGSRLRMQSMEDGAVHFAKEWEFLDDGGLDTLRRAMAANQYRLVIIDTLSRALVQADQLDLADMSLLMGSLQDMTKNGGTTILTIDHHKKPIGNVADPIDDILGSTGKAAIVDAALGLYRGRGKHDATLRATGRDMEDVDLAVRFDGQLACWQLEGEAGEVRRDSVQAEVLEAIRELVTLGQVTSTSNIAQHLGKTKGNVSREIAELVQAGKLVKGEKTGRVVPYLLTEPGCREGGPQPDDL